MPIYISRGKFTTDAVKGMLAHPENREDAVATLFRLLLSLLCCLLRSLLAHECTTTSRCAAEAARYEAMDLAYRGMAIVARTAMIAIAIVSSTSVKAFRSRDERDRLRV